MFSNTSCPISAHLNDYLMQSGRCQVASDPVQEGIKPLAVTEMMRSNKEDLPRLYAKLHVSLRPRQTMFGPTLLSIPGHSPFELKPQFAIKHSRNCQMCNVHTLLTAFRLN